MSGCDMTASMSVLPAPFPRCCSRTKTSQSHANVARSVTTRERHLRRALSRVAFEDREADRSVDRTIHDVARDAWGPVRLVVKETPHEVAGDVSRVARHDVVPHARRV